MRLQAGSILLPSVDVYGWIRCAAAAAAAAACSNSNGAYNGSSLQLLLPLLQHQHKDPWCLLLTSREMRRLGMKHQALQLLSHATEAAERHFSSTSSSSSNGSSPRLLLLPAIPRPLQQLLHLPDQPQWQQQQLKLQQQQELLLLLDACGAVGPGVSQVAAASAKSTAAAATTAAAAALGQQQCCSEELQAAAAAALRCRCRLILGEAPCRSGFRV